MSNDDELSVLRVRVAELEGMVAALRPVAQPFRMRALDDTAPAKEGSGK